MSRHALKTLKRTLVEVQKENGRFERSKEQWLDSYWDEGSFRENQDGRMSVLWSSRRYKIIVGKVTSKKESGHFLLTKNTKTLFYDKEKGRT